MKYSITIPAYKATFLEECIESILAQTYSNFEVIILNDASPENIDSIVNKFDDSRIRYYKNYKNVGAINVVDNWNKLLNLSHGDYVICMGDDDKLAASCLSTYNEFIIRYPNQIVFHARTAIIDEKSNIINLQDDRPIHESAYSMLWHSGRINYIGDYLFKTKDLKEKGGFYKFPMALASDWATALLMAQCNGVINAHDILFYYRVSASTITSSGDGRQQAEASLMFQKWLFDFLKKEPADSLDVLYRNLINLNYQLSLSRSRGDFMANDLARHFVKNVCYWLCKRKYYNLSWKIIIIAFLKAILYKITKYK